MPRSAARERPLRRRGARAALRTAWNTKAATARPSSGEPEQPQRGERRERTGTPPGDTTPAAATTQARRRLVHD
jgi:hypothetical protein